MSTTHNPADLASLGMSATEMIDKGLWWKGPDFLQDEEIQPEEIPIDTELLSDPEVKKTRVLSTKALPQTEKSLDDRLKYFSSWQRARRAIAVCLRFKRKLLERKTKKTEPQNEKKEYQPVDVTEMKVAETVIIKAAQGAFVKEDLYCRKRWRKVQYLATQFWRRWISEFIPLYRNGKNGRELNII